MTQRSRCFLSKSEHLKFTSFILDTCYVAYVSIYTLCRRTGILHSHWSRVYIAKRKKKNNQWEINSTGDVREDWLQDRSWTVTQPLFPPVVSRRASPKAVEDGRRPHRIPLLSTKNRNLGNNDPKVLNENIMKNCGSWRNSCIDKCACTDKVMRLGTQSQHALTYKNHRFTSTKCDRTERRLALSWLNLIWGTLIPGDDTRNRKPDTWERKAQFGLGNMY